MHLLYLDDSGSVADASQRYFVLAGISVFERDTHWIEQDLNGIAGRFNNEDPHSVELHGSPMRSGREGWKQFPLQDRKEAIIDALTTGVTGRHNSRKHSSPRIFAAAVDKTKLAGQDPVEVAFEEISKRFDKYLARLHKHNNTQRGMIVFDRSSTESTIQTLAREFKYNGHQTGTTRNYAEVPVFMDSKASRLIQLADLVAYAIFRNHEHGDDTYFSVFANCFDAVGAVKHGYYVV